MKRVRKIDPDAELKAMRIRWENSVNLHKTAHDNQRLRTAIADSEKIRNFQIQYSSLREAHERLPLGLQGAASDRLKALTAALTALDRQYPQNFPTGPGPRQDLRAAGQRLLY
jgi:hypothetical protein